MENYIKKNYICPITKMIFLQPVMADDGIIYEEHAIRDWYAHNNNTSPITKEKMSDTLKPILAIKNTIDEYLKIYPHEKEEQFAPLRTHEANKKLIDKIFKEGKNYQNLLSYTNFNMEYIFLIKKTSIFCENASVDVQKYFIDNCDNIEEKNDNRCSLIHCVFFKSPMEIVKHILSKNISFNEANYDIAGDNPVHWLCQNKNLTIEILIQVTDKIKDFHKKNTSGKTPFYYLCSENRNNTALIRYYIVNIIEPAELNSKVSDTG